MWNRYQDIVASMYHQTDNIPTDPNSKNVVVSDLYVKQVSKKV
jgi:hypothetical protein